MLWQKVSSFAHVATAGKTKPRQIASPAGGSHCHAAEQAHPYSHHAVHADGSVSLLGNLT